MLSKLSLIFTALLLGACVFFYWKSPWSPIVQHRIRDKISTGDVDRAIDLLVWRSDNAFNEKSAQKDLWLAAKLSALKSKKDARSRMLIDKCLQHPAFGHVADAYAILASMSSETDADQSIVYWTRAIQSEPEHPEVGSWWIRIANIYEARGDSNSALMAWKEAADDPDLSPMANLAMGRLQLKSDPSSSLIHFKEAANDISLDRSRTAELGQQLAMWEIKRHQMIENRR